MRFEEIDQFLLSNDEGKNNSEPDSGVPQSQEGYFDILQQIKSGLTPEEFQLAKE